MFVRRSINIVGFSHGKQPIPAASRVGPLVVTGGVYGLNRETGALPNDASEQAKLMFENLRSILDAAGVTCESVVRMTIFVRTPAIRDVVNAEWVKMFPDASSRPARHTIQNDNLPENMLVQCDAIAFASGT